ncbi:MAG: F0F1 ATP synthase subunit delta [Clostridia bacterium]|nr:F0F1 ATP synthase subunit delta [Clostridia bacterium]
MPLVERRYAEALIDISGGSGAIDAYLSELQAIVEIFNRQSDFKFFLLNPEIKVEIKKEVVKKVFLGQIRPEILNFLMLLLDKGRIKFVPGILDEYTKMADKKRNILSMTVISAEPLDDLQVQEIKLKYMKSFNVSAVKVRTEIDKSLIGGVKVKIGDKVSDGSLKGRLHSLKEILIG